MNTRFRQEIVNTLMRQILNDSHNLMSFHLLQCIFDLCKAKKCLISSRKHSFTSFILETLHPNTQKTSRQFPPGGAQVDQHWISLWPMVMLRRLFKQHLKKALHSHPQSGSERRFLCLLHAMTAFYRILFLLSGKLIIYFKLEL